MEAVSIHQYPLGAFLRGDSRVFWVYLLTNFTLAYAVSLLAERQQAPADTKRFAGFRSLFPKSAYFHRSAVADVLFFLINTLISGFLLAPFFLLHSAIADMVYQLFGGQSLYLSTTGEVSAWWSVLYTIAMVMAADFGLFLAHWLEHRNPYLWEFHKVHHSAEVMNPVTVFRMHPVDDILAISFSALISGPCDALFRLLSPEQHQVISVLNLNLVVFFFYIFAYNLRHSHLWISYGPFFEKFFISPAQHQIHHSKARKHWDKNFGFIFSIWDRMFGTLFLANRVKEKIEFGLGDDGEEQEFHSPWRMYTRPFVKIFRNKSNPKPG